MNILLEDRSFSSNKPSSPERDKTSTLAILPLWISETSKTPMTLGVRVLHLGEPITLCTGAFQSLVHAFRSCGSFHMVVHEFGSPLIELQGLLDNHNPLIGYRGGCRSHDHVGGFTGLNVNRPAVHPLEFYLARWCLASQHESFLDAMRTAHPHGPCLAWKRRALHHYLLDNYIRIYWL